MSLPSNWVWVAHATLPRGEQGVCKRRRKTGGGRRRSRASGDRLFCAKRAEDAALDLPWRGHEPGDKLPLCAAIGLDDPDAPISAAVDATGAGSVDLDAVPLLAVPLWAMSPKERAQIEARLPFQPSS